MAKRPAPPHQLSNEERQEILDTCNEPRFASLPPSQIVPILADENVYLASESTFYRILRAQSQLRHRGRAKERQKRPLPTTHIANRPNQVWSWDITYLPSTIKGQHFYLYLIMDIYSRKIVSFEVYEQESGELAAALLQRAILTEKCFKPLVLHSDNGSPMKSFTFKAKLLELGIFPSYSRPRVSNDNPYSESMFRTLKYCPTWPSEFKNLENAREWVSRFAYCYNEKHRHSMIKFVTPGQRHRGEDIDILDARKRLYQRAKKEKPLRWRSHTRDWNPSGPVPLNPCTKDEQAQTAA